MSDLYDSISAFEDGPMHPQKCEFCERQCWASEPWTQPYVCSPCAIERLLWYYRLLEELPDRAPMTCSILASDPRKTRTPMTLIVKGGIELEITMDYQSNRRNIALRLPHMEGMDVLVLSQAEDLHEKLGRILQHLRQTEIPEPYRSQTDQ